MAVIIDPADFAETFAANNVYTFTLNVKPDLMVSPYYLWTTPPTGTTVLVTATVYNVGAVTATDVLVGFYGDDRLEGGSPLFTLTIPQLGPAGSMTLNEQVAGPLACTLYVYRGLCQRVYLPIVLRDR